MSARTPVATLSRGSARSDTSARRACAERGGQAVPARGQAVAISSSDLRVSFSVRSTPFSSSSSATRTIASAARWSESSRATASRRPSASASSARRVSTLSRRAELGGSTLGGDDSGLELGRRLLGPADLGRHRVDEGAVLTRLRLAEGAVGLGLLSPVGGRVAACLDQLGVGDADGRRPEDDGKDGSDRHEGEGCAEDGADDDDRRGDDQCGSDHETGTALPTTSLWGRHVDEARARRPSEGRDTRVRAAPRRPRSGCPRPRRRRP